MVVFPFLLTRERGGNVLSEQAKAVRCEYHRKWRERNRDKVRMYQKRYWERKAKEVAQRGESGRDQ